MFVSSLGGWSNDQVCMYFPFLKMVKTLLANFITLHLISGQMNSFKMLNNQYIEVLRLYFLSLISGFYLFSLHAELTCTNLLEGQPGTIDLGSPPQKNDQLTFKCGQNVLYNRRKEKVEKKPYVNMDDKGSLILTNVSKSMEATCRAEQFDGNGKSILLKNVKICVLCKYNKTKMV